MKKIGLKLALLVVGFLSLSIVFSQPTQALDVLSGSCGSAPNNAVCDADDDDLSELLGNVIRTLLVLVGMVAVIMLIVGGFRYVTSNGDSAQMSAAKNTILYAVIGVIVAASSFAIVNFVLERIG
jgi:hypothetical protein